MRTFAQRRGSAVCLPEDRLLTESRSAPPRPRRGSPGEARGPRSPHCPSGSKPDRVGRMFFHVRRSLEPRPCQVLPRMPLERATPQDSTTALDADYDAEGSAAAASTLRAESEGLSQPEADPKGGPPTSGGAALEGGRGGREGGTRSTRHHPSSLAHALISALRPCHRTSHTAPAIVSIE